MTFADKLGRKFIVTGEVEPEAAVSELFLKKAEKFRPYVDALNVIDSPLGIPQLSSLVASYILKQNGFEPVLQICARDRNKTAIINDLLGAKLLGINNVLAITGDYPQDAKPVYEFDSVSLLRLIKREMPKRFKGFEMNVGAAYNPMAQPNEPEQIKLEKKLKYVDFIQTQMTFDLDHLENEVVRKNRKKILVGIFPLAPGHVEYFNKNIPGISISQEVAKSVRTVDDGIRLANKLAHSVKERGFGGIHLMLFGIEDRIGEILEGIV